MQVKNGNPTLAAGLVTSLQSDSKKTWRCLWCCVLLQRMPKITRIIWVIGNSSMYTTKQGISITVSGHKAVQVTPPSVFGTENYLCNLLSLDSWCRGLVMWHLVLRHDVLLLLWFRDSSPIRLGFLERTCEHTMKRAIAISSLVTVNVCNATTG